MKWRRGTRSQYIEDRRRTGRRGGRGVKLGAGGAIIGLILYFLVGPEALTLFGNMQTSTNQSQEFSQHDQEMTEFVSFLINDLQSFWKQQLRGSDVRYKDARLVLFSRQVDSACGFSTAATGPFYCPGDHKIYLDLSFFGQLKRNFGAPGDFAQAYVVAHEMAHHVQTLLGISKSVARKRRAHPQRANALSVLQELQADCLAGVWAHATKHRQLLDPGDLEEALTAAASIGDDRLQRQHTGTVRPETWTHGSSKQRATWFRRGYQSGRLEDCDTFSAEAR